MEAYETEEQQVEAIKKFWHEYGNQIIVGALIGLGGLYGLNTYKDSLRQAEAEAAQAYAKAEQTTELQAFSDAYDESAYAGLAQLKIAKSQVDAGEFEQAANTLTQLINAQSLPDSVHDIAKLRLARVQLELGQIDTAIAALKGKWTDALATEVNALLGDALVTKGDLVGARQAYQDAINKAALGANTVTIQMRLDDLAEPAPILIPAAE